MSQPERRIPQPNGSVFVSRAQKYVEHDLPVATLIGGGVQQRLGDRVAVRADVQLVTLLYLPLGTRISSSVVIPLGPRLLDELTRKQGQHWILLT